MLDLISLPKDVLTLIISFIRLKSDLRNTSRACKALHSVAIAPVYQKMVIEESCDPNVLAAALNPENEGLQHVRHLTLSAATDDFAPANTKLDKRFCLLANLLPRDILLTFTLDCSATLLPQAMLTLHRRQRHLRTRRIDHRPVSDSLQHLRDLSNMTCLHLEISNQETAAFASEVMAECPRLRHLELRAALAQYCKVTGHSFKLAPGRAAASRQIFWVLFNHMLFRIGEKIPLQSLQLYGLDLSGAATARLLAVVDMSKLYCLGLQQCWNSVEFLSRTKPTGVPTRMMMHSLTIVGRVNPTHDPSLEETVEVREDDAIDYFLGSFSGLENLIIAAPEQEALKPSLAALTKHAATLKMLYLDCKWDGWPGGSDGYFDHHDSAALGDFLAQCSRLEQLGIQTPYLFVDIAVESLHRQLEGFADAIGAAPSLRSLRIVTLPDQDDLPFDVFDDPAGNALVEKAFQAITTLYMNKAPNLRAVGVAFPREFGAPAVPLIDLSIAPHFYVRWQCIDPYGKTSVIAMQVDSKTRREIEPVSDLLDLRLNRGDLLRVGFRL